MLKIQTNTTGAQSAAAPRWGIATPRLRCAANHRLGAYRSNEDASQGGRSPGPHQPLSPEELVKASTPVTPPPSRASGTSSPASGHSNNNSSRSSSGNGNGNNSRPLSNSLPGLAQTSLSSSLKAASQKPSFPVALVAALASLPFEGKDAASGPLPPAAQPADPAAAAAAAGAEAPGAAAPKPPSWQRLAEQNATEQAAAQAVPPAPPAARIPDPPLPASTINNDSASSARGQQAPDAAAEPRQQLPGAAPGPSEAAAAAAAAVAALQQEAAAAAVGAAPIDSWGGSLEETDEDAEQLAKARVIELLTHPQETELQLLAEAEARQQGCLNVSTDYIEALVRTATDPSVGMPHPEADRSSSGSAAASEQAAAATAPDASAAASNGGGISPAAPQQQRQPSGLPTGPVNVVRPSPAELMRYQQLRELRELEQQRQQQPPQQQQQQRDGAEQQQQQHPGANEFFTGSGSQASAGRSWWDWAKPSSSGGNGSRPTQATASTDEEF